MTTLEDLYIYYCRRCDCRPNSKLCEELRTAYEAAGQQRLLECLDLSSNYVGPRGVAPVLELVRNIHNMTVLDLRNNKLEHEQLEFVVQALAKHPSIQCVDLSNNDLHDSSLPHILFLLETNQNIVQFRLAGNDLLPSSLQRVDEAVQRNFRAQQQRAVEAAEDAQLGEAIRAARPKFQPHKSETAGELTQTNSGGHFHFASWRKNPQFQLYLSTTASVRITMKIHDPVPTKQFGFAVLKGKGLVKTIEVAQDDILAESPFDHETCSVLVRLAAANRNRCEGPYFVLPFSFLPQRTCTFTLTCEIVEDSSIEGGFAEGAFITVEPLDSRYDWAVSEASGTWSTDNAGGCLSHPSWRDNVMYHIQYHGTAAARHVATLFIVLTKSNDNDVNDEREIGMYLFKKNAVGPAAPVVLSASDQLVQAVDHRRETSITMKVDTSCGALDWYLLPCTAAPGQFGSYTVSVFSTCPIQMTPLHAPHGWAAQVVNGAWDMQRNGGCRRDNVSAWVNNPSWILEHNSPSPIAIIVSLEVLPPPNSSSSSISLTTTTAAGVPLLDAPPLAAPLEAQLLLLENNLPDLPPMQITPFSQREAILTLQYLPAGQYLLVATTKRTGCHGAFRLRIFTECTVYVSQDVVLASRIREAQLASYESENVRRRELALRAVETATALVETAASSGGEEFVTATAEREAAMREYLASGQLFTDKDFPRGASSLWLGVDSAPSWAPNVADWRRPTELVMDRSVRFAPQWRLGTCRLSQLDNDWLMSALGMISTKPDWLARIVRGYDPEYGVAQFSFFKNGQWHVVTIDDYLPVDSLDAVSFTSNADDKYDFFIPLVEKAYAKFHRCYQALSRQVAPAMSLSTHIMEALMDLSAGLCTEYLVTDNDSVSRSAYQSARNDTEDLQRTLAGESLWQTLRTCTSADRILGLRLASEAVNSTEKQHVGLVRDRLYAVLDARAVEGKRLVRLHQFWPSEDSVAPFRGKYADGSANWTQTLLFAVDHQSTRNTGGGEAAGNASGVPPLPSLWMSLEEVEYYFSHLYIVKKYRHSTFIEGGFSPAHTGGSVKQRDTWVENAQYALHCALPEDNSPLTVTVGVHQRDARSTLTRRHDVVLQYDSEIGVTVFLTNDNTRRLATLSEKEYVITSRTVAGRDCFLTVTIDPKFHPESNRAIVMPFQTTPKLALQCFLSAWSDASPTTVSLIQTSSRTICEGEWRGGSSGGPPRSGTWRNNPQYHLYPSEGMEVTVVLRQRNDLSSTEEYIGFTVHRAKGIRSLLDFNPEDVVLSVKHENTHAVAGTIRLAGMKERRGMPYVIVPSCSRAHVDTGFTLEVVANKKVHLCRIPAETDWRSVVLPVTLRYSDRNTGGSFRFSSWRNNPQFLLSLPVEKEGEVVVNVTNHNESDDTDIGVVLMRTDPWDLGRRRKVSVKPEDILAQSSEQPRTAELRSTVAVRGQEPLIVMPFTSTPLSEVTLTISVYAAMDVCVDSVQEWYSSVVEGSWELGLSAGGHRAANRTWINNPFFALSVTRQTRVSAVLLQYPRGPEKPQVKRVGKQRAYLPPPIVNPQNKINIGLDLVLSDEENTLVQSSKHTYEGEVGINVVLPPCMTTPYFFVPHSFEPEQEADFTLMVYADQPFQLQEFKKTRRYL